MGSQQQQDTATDLEERIEDAFSSMDDLWSLRSQVAAADLTDSQRDLLLGRIEQYRVDARISDEAKLHDEEAPDGGSSGGSEG